MVIQYLASDTETYKCESHIFEVTKNGFKGKVIIVEHDNLIYVRQVLPINGSEKLENFKFKNDIEKEVIELYKAEYKHRINRRRNDKT